MSPNESATEEHAILEGVVSVSAALHAQNRTIHAIYIRQDRQDMAVARLETLAHAAGISVQRVDDGVIGQYARGRTHGGVVAMAGPRRYLRTTNLGTGTPCPFIVMLDGLEDPFNFGHAVRALYAAGADGLVVRARNWLHADGILLKASAGATDLMPTAVTESPVAAAHTLRRKGLTIACAVRDRNAIPMHQAHLSGPLFLIIGGEKRGVSRATRDVADYLVQIPYDRTFGPSLGLAAAATALAFEVMRQRRSVIPTVQGQ